MRISKPPEERKLEIIETSKRLFEQNGIENTKISDIVKEIGVAKGLFYYYFKSKAELMRAIIESILIEQDLRFKTILKDEKMDFYQKIIVLIELFSHKKENLFISDKMIQEMIGTKTFEKQLLVNLKQLIKIGVKEGKLTLKYPIETATMMYYGLKYLIEHPEEVTIHSEIYLTMVEQTLHLKNGVLTKLIK